VRLERNEEILLAGLGAAREQMEKHPARPDYPQDYIRLYGWLEDKLFNLFEAIRLKNYDHVFEMSGEIIVTAAEIAEYTELCINGLEKEEREV